jgi:hypothetical protein
MEHRGRRLKWGVAILMLPLILVFVLLSASTTPSGLSVSSGGLLSFSFDIGIDADPAYAAMADQPLHSQELGNPPASPSEGDGWLDGWDYRIELTANSSKVDSDLPDFPFLVKLTSSNFDFDHCDSGGTKIRFATKDGETLIPYERERHDSSSQKAEYWVKGNLSSSSDTIFYMYYETVAGTDGEDATNVWDSYFEAVYHLNEASADTSVDDSTTQNPGTKLSASNPTQATGRIGYGQEFDQTNDGIYAEDSASLDITANITIEAWVYADDQDSDQTWVGKFDTSDNDSAYNFAQSSISTGFTQFQVREHGDASEWSYNQISMESYHGQWTYFGMSYTAGTDAEVYHYTNDAVNKTGPTHTADSIYNSSEQLVIGYRNHGASKIYYFDGKLDEIRISSTARSDAWMKASYHSGGDTLLSYGSEEVFGWLAGWETGKRIKLTVDRTAHNSTNITHFPATLILDSSAGKTSANVTCVFDELQSDANRFKIAATRADGKTQVYVEIQKWDDANEQAILNVGNASWTFTGASDTEFYLYYDSSHADNFDYVGNVGMVAAQNVWDPSFKAVFHLEDVGTISQSVTDNIFKVTCDPLLHSLYGLGMPVTYKLQIPNELTSGGKCFYRYKESDSWTQMTDKESTDANTPTTFYNQEEVCRWDYSNHFAYVSIAFDDASDEIYVYIENASETKQTISFISIPTYYDNRKMATIWTLDDIFQWSPDHQDNFITKAQSFNIWLTIGCADWGGSNWDQARKDEVQAYIDDDYIEVGQHTQNHEREDDIDDITYFWDEEAKKSVLVDFLNFPDIYKRGNDEYIWAFIKPYGSWSNADARRTLQRHKYLVGRDVGSDNDSFTSWNNVDGTYDETDSYHIIQDTYDDDIATLESEWDTCYTNGKVYSAMSHSSQIANYTSGGYLHQFMDHISNKKDVWYVGLGAAYAYLFVKQLIDGTITEGGYSRYLPDSTGTFNDNRKLAAGQPEEATGVIDKAQDFDGINDYGVSHHPYGHAWGSGEGTVEAWVKVDTKPGAGSTEFAICRGQTGTGGKRYGIWIRCDSGTDTYLQTQIDDDGTGGLVNAGSSTDYISTGVWYYCVGVRDNSANLLRWYKDYTTTDTSSISGYGNLDDGTSGNLQLGSSYQSGSPAGYADCKLDEVRISVTARADEWVKATYNSHQDSLLTYSTEQTIGISQTPATWSIGSVAEGGNYTTGITWGNLTNTGTEAIDVAISMGNMTSGNYTWVISDTATAGNMTFGMKAGNTTSYSTIVKGSEPYNTLVSDLAGGNSWLWGMQFFAPTVFMDGNEKSGNVTLTAILAS